MLPTSRARLWNAKHPCHEYGVIDHAIVWAVVDSRLTPLAQNWQGSSVSRDSPTLEWSSEPGQRHMAVTGIRS